MFNRHGLTPEQEFDLADAYLDGIVNEDGDFIDDEYVDDEPDLDFQFEHDSSMSSAGWGTDEDYGYYGGDEDY